MHLRFPLDGDVVPITVNQDDAYLLINFDNGDGCNAATVGRI